MASSCNRAWSSSSVRGRVIPGLVCLCLAAGVCVCTAAATAQDAAKPAPPTEGSTSAGAPSSPATSSVATSSVANRVVGILTAIDGNSLTVKTDAGTQATVVVSDSTRMLQTVPGAKNLSGATPIHPADLEVGDRVLARATLGDDGKTYTASTLIAIKQSDLAQKHQQEREAWMRGGEGGLVKSVDPAAQTVTISVMSPAGPKTVLVHATPATVNRRYAADSIEFDAAKPAPMSEIKPGDQLRARGTRSADASELQADEIVSGTFRNVVATVTSVDAASGTLTVNDLVAKTPVVIKVTQDSQLRKLPPMMAQGLAMRLRGDQSGGSGAETGGARSGMADAGPAKGSTSSGGNASGTGGTGGDGGAYAQAGGSAAGGASRRGTGSPDPGAGSGSSAAASGEAPGRGPGRGDLQQALSRAPLIRISDLAKGDAVMVVTTQGSATVPPTAVTLLAGVEPMLQASTTGSRSMLTSSWSLSAPGGEGQQ